MPEEIKPREPAAEPAASPKPASARGPYLLAGVLAVLLVGAVVWKFSAVRNVEERAVAERTEIVEQTRKALADQTGYFLRLTAKPLVWAIRREMLRNNLEQVDEYLVQLVKEPAIKQVLIAGPDGTVLLATDKKLEEHPMTEVRPELNLEIETTTIVEDVDGGLLVLSPIMGLDARIATLFLVYAPETVDIEGRKDGPKAP